MSDYLEERILNLTIRTDSPSLLEDVGKETGSQLMPGGNAYQVCGNQVTRRTVVL